MKEIKNPKQMCKGKLCRNGPDLLNYCFVKFNAYVCTRKKWHKGNHIACGALKHNHKIWK